VVVSSSRWFVGTATTSYSDAYKAARPGEGDRPELIAEVTRMATLFADLGYQVAHGFDIDMPRQEFTDRLRAFLTAAERTSDDTVVVYYTGHGLVDDGELFLPMTDTTGDVTYSSLSASKLTGEVLRGAPVHKLLYIVDTCYAGAGVTDLAAEALTFVRRIRTPETSPSIGLLVAARPNQQASPGAFTQAFVEAVRHRATAGHDVPYIPVDGLVGVINDTTPEWQRARYLTTGEGPTQFLPNPRYDAWLRGLDLRTQAEQGVRARREAERKSHVLPRAQGLDEAGRDDLWLFEGRHAALADVVGWLNRGPAAPSRPRWS
jgi:hypothetical protein